MICDIVTILQCNTNIYHMDNQQPADSALNILKFVADASEFYLVPMLRTVKTESTPPTTLTPIAFQQTSNITLIQHQLQHYCMNM